MLYRQILEEGVLDMNRFSREGYPWDVMSEAACILGEAGWGKTGGMGIVRLTPIGAKLLEKKLDE
jgi:hypothetical protein